jgi:hypothetical protein
MVRRTQRRQRSQKKTQRRQRSQRGGSPSYAYTGPAGISAGGVPYESRAGNDGNCEQSFRPAPQAGGGCGCNAPQSLMRGGGGGSGGYGFNMDTPSKLYPEVRAGVCPSQAGGASNAELLGIDSYPAGYALDRPVFTPSASYLDYTGYDRTCKGGARKSRKNRKSRKSRKSRNNRRR